MLEKVISGAQTGADRAGLDVAKKFGIPTGGTMPFGYKALDGCHPKFREEYGIVMHTSSSYKPRTRKNVADSDGTIRLARDFNSRGEICTLNAINDYGKEKFDVDLSDPPPISDVIQWIEEKNIRTLNVAGNSEETSPGTYAATTAYLTNLFVALGFNPTTPHKLTTAETTSQRAG